MVMFSILLMIGMIGYLHKKNLSEMDKTVTSIYEDRLVANEYIFELSRKIVQKKESLDEGRYDAEEVTKLNHEIDLLIDAFEDTKLTADESKLWGKLKTDLSLAHEFENQILHNPISRHSVQLQNHLNNQYELIHSDLEGLSIIQLREGKSLLDNSKKIVASNSVSSHLEVALIIIVLLIFLMLNPTYRMNRIKKLNNLYN